MNKKVLTLVIIIILIAIGGGVWFVVGQPQEQGNISSNLSEELTQAEIQAEIDRILNDDSIDISDWPTFTNTKYGWSIQYHPEGEWASNSQLHGPETASNPSYRVSNSSYLWVWVADGNEHSVLEEVAKSRNAEENYDQMKRVTINGDLYLVNWRSLDFYTHSVSGILNININELRNKETQEQLIKSILFMGR